jgi:hypothetical protein
MMKGFRLNGTREPHASIADVLKHALEKQRIHGAAALVADKDKVLALAAASFADLATK